MFAGSGHLDRTIFGDLSRASMKKPYNAASTISLRHEGTGYTTAR